MAGVAFADGTGEFIVPTAQDVVSSDDFGAGDYTFSFSIDKADVVYTAAETVSSLKGGEVLALYGTYSGTEYYTNGYVLDVIDGAITLSVGRGSLSGLPDGTSPLLPTTNFSISSDGVSGGLFMSDTNVPLTLEINQKYVIKSTHSIDGRSVMQSVSIYKDGSNDALATVNYKGNMSGGKSSTKIAVWGNTSYNVTIPEPATATLSLLALAGLAARRRRASR